MLLRSLDFQKSLYRKEGGITTYPLSLCRRCYREFLTRAHQRGMGTGEEYMARRVVDG